MTSRHSWPEPDRQIHRRERIRFAGDSRHAGDQAADRQLAALAARLSQELGVAVAAVRVTSGNELVLSGTADRATQSLRQVVMRGPAVRKRHASTLQRQCAAAQITLALDLRRDSEAGKLVRQTAQAKRKTTKEVERWCKACVGADTATIRHVSNRGQLVLTGRHRALTLDLIERSSAGRMSSTTTHDR